MASAVGGKTVYVGEGSLAFGSSSEKLTMTSGPVCDNYVVTFLGRKDSVRFISMVNLGDLPGVNLITKAFRKFRENDCVPGDIIVSVRGGWEKVPASKSLGDYILNIIRSFRQKIDTKLMWQKKPMDFSRKTSLSMDPECFFKGFSFNSETGKILEIPKPIPEGMKDVAVILQRTQSSIRKTISGEELAWPSDLLPVGLDKKPEIDRDDSKKKTVSSFQELLTGSSTHFLSIDEMTKQIKGQWREAFGSLGSQVASESEVVPGHGDLDDEKELAELMKQIELRENGPVSSGEQEKNPKTKF